MALFKVSQGPSSNLNTQALTEGFCWFTPDDGKFYIDAYKNSVLTRIALNAAHADTATTATTAAGVSGIIPVEHGGTGANNAGTARTNLGLGSMATEVAADYIKKSTLSGAFDVMYSSAANTPARLAANTTTTKKFLSMTGTGSAGKAPTWATVTKSDVGLSNVTNHAQVTAVTWDSTNKKLQQSVSGGTATDIVTIGTIKTALNLTKADVALGNVPNVDATNASNISSGTLSADRLPTTGVTSSSASFGPSANASPAHQAGFTVPYFTVDKYGRITAASNITITLPPDNNVTQTNSTSNKDYRIILSGTNDDTTRVEGTNKSTNLRFNPSTKILSVGGSISATGDLTVTGDTNLNSDTTIASATVGALEVTGNATFTQIPQSVTPAASSNDNSIATTAFVKSGIAGLAGAMHFRGITTTNIIDGSTTDPLISGYNFSTDKLAGDVVIDSNSSYEYVWTGAKWERLGPDGSYKTVQTAVTKPNAVTNKWVSAIGQNANGNIDVSYTTLDTTGTWQGNATTASTAAAVPWSGITGKPETYPPSSHTHAYLPLAGGTLTGDVIHNSSTGARKFYFSRGAGTGESTGVWVDDSYTYFDVTNDETTANVKFTLSATDSEGSDGSRAQTSYVIFNGANGKSTVRADYFVGDLTGNATTATTAAAVPWAGITSKPSTSIAWGAGTTAGPTLTVTAAGSSSSAVAIPAASKTASGIVTTGSQNFIGDKGFGTIVKRFGYDSSDNANKYIQTIFYNKAGTQLGSYFFAMGDTTNVTAGQYYWRQYSPKSTPDTSTTGFCEDYYLPRVASGLTENKTYAILTTKNVISIAQGGTGASTAGGARTNLGLGSMATEVATDYIKKSTLSSAYDIMYSSAANTPARLAANTTTTRKFLRMKGTGSAGAAPEWDTVTKSDVGLSNVTNHAQVTAVTWDTDNKKLQQSVSGGTATDIVTIGTIKTALALTKSDVGLNNVPNINATNASNITSGTLSADRLATSGVTAGNYGPSANASPAHAAGFSVPYFTVDNKGRVTAASTKTITLPPDSDTKVTQTNITATTSADYRILLSGSTNDTTETTTSNKNTNLRFNTGTKTLSVGGNITATGDLTLTGDAYLNNNTYAAGIAADSLIVNGSARFNQIPTSVTPEANSNDTSVATTAFVMNAFSTNDAMVFKDVVNANGDLPANHKQGWTYKVGTAGTYAGQVCEVGDTIYCVTDGTSANNAHWVVIQNNVDGAVYRGSNSMTNTAVVIADGTAGKVKSSGVTIDSSNNLTAPSTSYVKAGNITIGGTAGNNQNTLSSSYTLYENRPAGCSIVFQQGGTNKIWMDTSNNLRPDTNNTLSVGTSDYKWASMYAGTFYGALSGNASSATKAGTSGIWLYPQGGNELNFGGTNTGTTLYFGYRASDSRPIPTKFVFGGATGTADLQAKAVYLGSGTTSYVSSTQYTGNAATATTADKVGHSLTLANNRSFDGSADVTLLTNDLTPAITKVYESTSYYSSNNSYDNSTWYFMNVRPDSLYKSWRILFKIRSYCPNYVNVDSTSWVEIYGRYNSATSAHIFNEFYDRGHYYIAVMPLTVTGYNNGYGFAVGVSIRYATGYQNSNYYRTFVVDYYNCEGCTISFLDTPVTWANWTGGTTTNYGSILAYNACDRGLQETGDNNSYSLLEMSSNYIINSPTFRFPSYTLFGFDRADKAQALSTYNAGYTGNTTSINTARDYNTAGIDWTKGLHYYTGSNNYAAGANLNITIRTAATAVDLRQSDNCIAGSSANTLGMVLYKPVYLRGVIKEDGLFYLAPLSVTYNNSTYQRVWTQDIPTAVETNGTYQYVYWFVGYPYYDSSYSTSLYRVNLFENNPMYWFHNGRFEEYLQNAVTADKIAWSGITSKPTTIAGYGITDAKIENGVITLGSNTITPLTSHQDISGKVSKSGDTMTGTLYINNTTDADATNDAGALIIGNKAGANVAIDDNEVMARNNKTATTLYLNYGGGLVQVGSGGISTGNIKIGGGAADTDAGKTISSSSTLYLKSASGTSIIFQAAGASRASFNTSGHFVPASDLTYNIGSNTQRWKNVFTNCLELSGPSSNPSATAGGRIKFSYDGSSNTGGSQPVYLAYTPNDSYRAPAGLKIMGDGTTGSSSPAWLEVEGNIYSNGSVNLTKAGECGVEVENTSQSHKVALIVGDSGNGGIYDRTNTKWIVYSDTSGNVTLNGNAVTASAVPWSGVINKPINFKAYSGALNSGGWNTLNGNVSGANLSIAYNNNAAAWNSEKYSASLVFGCSDTKGLLDVGYNQPIVTFGGASNGGSTNDNPAWYFKLKGTSAQTYTLPTSSKTLAATDGSNASGSWGINITGTLLGNLQNAQVFPNGKTDQPYHEVAVFNQVLTSQINTKLTLLITNYYGTEQKGIIDITCRWEANTTAPTWLRCEWITATGVTPANFIATWAYDSSTNTGTVKFYIKATGWYSFNCARLQEHSWGVASRKWVLQAANYGTHTMANIPSEETQVASILCDLNNNAATATQTYVTDTTPSSTTTYYLTYVTGRNSNQDLRANTDLYYYDTGTSSYLNVGSASNTGGLTLHNTNGKYGTILVSAFTDNRTFTLPDKTGTFALTSDLTDTKVSQSATTTANWRKVLLHYKDDAASTTAVSSSTNVVYAAVGVSVQPSTGTLRTNAYNVADHVTMQYNSTTQALDFIFS